ncbi:MAG: hypothetical protein IK135_05020 [Bacteroidales bacterium]|nr:hypothetical protein [Bacteroidales bacterium]
MKRFQNIVLLVLIALVGNAFAQKTDWEEDGLQGRVKKYELYIYRFNSDSVGYDVFMSGFYRCGFDVDGMIRFADSIKTDKTKEYFDEYKYDSLGYRVEVFSNGSVTRYQNEYDNQGHLLRRIKEIDVMSDDTFEAVDWSFDVPNDTVFYTCDEAGRLLNERFLDNMMHRRSIQRIYDIEGYLSEYIDKDLDQDDDSILFHKRYEYDKKGVLRKTEYFGTMFRGCRKYDSRGNFTFFQEENCGSNELLFKSRTRNRYKYDRNDSIIKEVSKTTKWYKSGSQIKSKFERRVSRNVDGIPIEEISISNHNNSITTTKFKFDELGRVIEEEGIGDGFPWKTKKVWRYYEDTQFVEYYANNHGKNYEYGEENMLFYDKQGNRIAHIKWGKGLVYRFEVFKYEYYK